MQSNRTFSTLFFGTLSIYQRHALKQGWIQRRWSGACMRDVLLVEWRLTCCRRKMEMTVPNSYREDLWIFWSSRNCKPTTCSTEATNIIQKRIFLFLFYQSFFFTTPTSHRAAGEERRPFFCSILPLPPAHKHSDIYLELCMWDDYDYHMFLIAALAFTRLLLYEIYHLIKLPLIDLWCKVSFCLFTWWFGTTFLLQ